MAPKHPRSPSSEPSKRRRHTTGAPSSPFSFSYPYVSSSTPSCPSDSPSNPFGRTHTWNLLQTLPPPTSFSKHLPLRFQYIKRGVSRENLEGIYRIVQVPQSYTLVHLRSLIGFLFGGAYGQIPPDDDDEDFPGHVFELKNDMSLYPSSIRPGQIMCGNTWTYSSNALDPYLYYPDWEPEDSPATKTPENIEEDVDDERKWTAEEDLTVAHVWIEGGDISRGVVYKHAPNLQIHITINTTSIEPRRGKGNLPYVFSACGLVYLEDPTEEDDLEAEDRTAQLDPETWNEPENAFAKYYRQHTLLPFAFTEEAAASSSASASASVSVSAAAQFSSSPARPSSSFYSSPSRDLSSPSRTRSASAGASNSSPGPGPFPKHTPAPRPSQRKRIRHLQHRIGTLTRAQHGSAPPERPRKKRKLLPVPRKGSVGIASDEDDDDDRPRRAFSEEL